MKVIACYSMKGGVGKTATSVNIAYWAARTGNRTLLIDLDPQGASSFYFKVSSVRKNWSKRFFDAYEHLVGQIKATEFMNLDIIPAQINFRKFDVMLSQLARRKTRLKKVLSGLDKEYDFIVLDCPPSIGHLAEAIFEASHAIFVPVIPSTLSERTFEQLHDFFTQNGYASKRIVPFFSMVQRQKNMHRNTMERLRRQYKRFLKVSIPFSTDVEKMGEFRGPLDTFAKSRPANKAYYALWKEMVPIIRRARYD
ncbi:ParA family protein [Marinibactrum halimedae]|uniref:Cobyrinic acid a,c-diamide synthase n=1 Tax=Marinibactrum halimedae TaxID=1444977 RepID=A0AA37T8Q7_9GAMM|nr:AAA family ATPase [Marinibactrum halimedae]MCD9458005.1 AAA family ATPase [Marinibactrum halimedae]GLS27631.1 cobyrinic acid a,c-diamide synthase [Marinibactrum halimedae]